MTDHGFICPITHQVMRDPVQDSDGYTYEREAIESWLRINQTSPMTRNRMTKTDLVPNRALVTLISRLATRPENDGTASPSLQVQHCRGTIRATAFAEDPQSRKYVDLSVVVDPGWCVVRATDNDSFLDIVKHCVRTIVHALDWCDTLSLVFCEERALVVLPRTEMSTAGKEKAETLLEGLCSKPDTNLWDGIRVGIESLPSYSAERGSFILVLTDGFPSSSLLPPRGIASTVKLYRQRFRSDFSLVPFGVGNVIDSRLLLQIASCCQSPFFHVPDYRSIGEVLLNALSNVLSVCATQALLTIGSESFDVGWICYGQKRDFVVRSDDTSTNVVLRTAEFIDIVVQPTMRTDPDPGVEAVTARMHLVSMLSSVSNAAEEARENCDIEFLRFSHMRPYAESIANSNDAFVKALNEDLGGKISGACVFPVLHSWGKHHLRSLLSAHSFQICCNFTNSSVQAYGGGLFLKTREHIEAKYILLPPQRGRKKCTRSLCMSALFDCS